MPADRLDVAQGLLAILCQTSNGYAGKCFVLPEINGATLSEAALLKSKVERRQGDGEPTASSGGPKANQL